MPTVPPPSASLPATRTASSIGCCRPGTSLRIDALKVESQVEVGARVRSITVLPANQ